MSSEFDYPAILKTKTYLEMDFRSAEFPSDVLSVKRFRVLFPQHFDGPDHIADGYASANRFFFPSRAEEPDHLMRLTELIQAERTVASAAYYQCFPDLHPDIINDEDREAIAASKQRLEENYLFFKLADSPETARLLIRQVEEQGEIQGRSDRAEGRQLFEDHSVTQARRDRRANGRQL